MLSSQPPVLFSITVVLSLALAGALGADETKVERAVRLVQEGKSWHLLRNNEPFYVQGAGGEGSPELLAQLGGNSIRTWGADHLQERLDLAQRHGLMVCVGIWLGHERHGFNYNDADQVAAQYEEVRNTILKFKEHPAVLLWGIGNEMEGLGRGDNAAVWSAVNNLARLVKDLDPHHPTMTVVAEIGGDRVKNIHRLCPAIDIVGINSYGGASSLPRRYRQAGGSKPYIVTEFGPRGPWEVDKTSWGAPLEPTSSQKAAFYERTYQALVEDAELCLGSFAFLWGHKQETSATWFGMLLPNGDRLASADTMAEQWSGKAPRNRCPVIGAPELVGSGRVQPNATLEARLSVSDPDGDSLEVRWVLQADPQAQGAGGDAQATPETFPDAIVESERDRVQVVMPDAGGAYRLFAYASDGKGGAAVSNTPLYVDGPVPSPRGGETQLPLVIYDEPGAKSPPYIPSGWMGNAKALRMDERCSDHPHSGKSCLRIDYSAADNWGGIVWQHPSNDWGDRPGGWDLTKAKRLVVWLRGENASGNVNLEFGILGGDKKFPDTAKGKISKVKLTEEWQEFSFDLAGKDLTRIKTGLAIVITGAGKPTTVFLDDARFE